MATVTDTLGEFENRAIILTITYSNTTGAASSVTVANTTGSSWTVTIHRLDTLAQLTHTFPNGTNSWNINSAGIIVFAGTPNWAWGPA